APRRGKRRGTGGTVAAPRMRAAPGYGHLRRGRSVRAALMSALQRAAVWPRAVRVALQFLTRLPLRIETPPQAREIGLSLACYPVVGLALGVILWSAALPASRLPGLLGAALVLALWVALTGALHLDGIADVADAWIGGHGDRERTLRIMQDP